MIQRGRTAPGDTHTTPPDGQPRDAQPKWRRDFPIDVAEDEYVGRRELVKFLVLTSAAFSTGQLWIGLKSLLRHPEPTVPAVAIAAVDALPVGGATTFFYPPDSAPRLLVRTGADTFVAYDQQCTHLLCPIVPAVAEGRLHCPCHNGWFDLQTGRPLAGPPRRALGRVLLEVRDGTVYAVGVEEGEA